MILLITEDLMMSSTVSSAVRAGGGTFRFVKSVERAKVKLEGNDCELLLVDLQTPGLDFGELIAFLAEVNRSVGYAQHVNVELLQHARTLPFDQVITRGQMHAGAAEIVGRALL